MTTIFKQLSDMLTHDEKIQFTLSKHNGQLAVLIQPVLKGSGEGLSESANQLRAALAMPLYVTANAETLDADFAGCLEQYRTTRNSLNTSLGAAMCRVKESAKEAQAGSQVSTSPAKAADTTKNEADTPAAVVTKKSLF